MCHDVSEVTVPYFMAAGTGASDDAGVEDPEKEFGGVAPLSSLVENYDRMSDDVFKVRARVIGAEHEDVQVRTDGCMTAWMLFHLQGDEEAGRVFLGDDAELLGNGNWQDAKVSPEPSPRQPAGQRRCAQAT